MVTFSGQEVVNVMGDSADWAGSKYAWQQTKTSAKRIMAKEGLCICLLLEGQ